MIHNALPGGLTDWNRGARISFGHAGSAGFDLAPLPAPASLPNDSGVQVSYVGSLGGVPQQVTGSVSMVDIGSIIGIDPQVPAASYTVRILMNEQLVATVPGLVGRITGPAQFPTGYGNVLAVLPSGSESGVDLKWSSSGSQSFTLPNGQSYVGNEIQLVGASMTHVDWVSHVTVLMRGIAEVVIRNEVVTQVGGACPADFNTDGVVNSQDYFDFLAAFFASAPAADFNHSGAIDSQDFFDFLTAFFAGC
jgi:hypothetical protein